MTDKNKTPAPPEKPTAYIFRPFITQPGGKVIWAKNYGLKAFRIPVAGKDN